MSTEKELSEDLKGEILHIGDEFDATSVHISQLRDWRDRALALEERAEQYSGLAERIAYLENRLEAQATCRKAAERSLSKYYDMFEEAGMRAEAAEKTLEKRDAEMILLKDIFGQTERALIAAEAEVKRLKGLGVTMISDMQSLEAEVARLRGLLCIEEGVVENALDTLTADNHALRVENERLRATLAEVRSELTIYAQADTSNSYATTKSVCRDILDILDKAKG